MFHISAAVLETSRVMQTWSCLCSKLCTSVLILSHLVFFVFFLFLAPTCLSLLPPPAPQHPLSSCRWCACVKTPNWLWRTAPHTSWTCCQTPTSTCAPSCLATKVKWRLWGRMSTSGSSWRTWPRRPNRPSACSRRERNACTRRTRSLGKWCSPSLCLWKAMPTAVPAVPSLLGGCRWRRVATRVVAVGARQHLWSERALLLQLPEWSLSLPSTETCFPTAQSHHLSLDLSLLRIALCGASHCFGFFSLFVFVFFHENRSQSYYFLSDIRF